MKVNISKEWFMSRAPLEEGQSVEAGSLRGLVGRIGTTNWNGVMRTVKVEKAMPEMNLAFVGYVTEEGQIIEGAACQLDSIEFDSPNEALCEPGDTKA